MRELRIQEQVLVSGEFTRVTLFEGIAVMDIHRPPLNALNIQTQRELAHGADLVSGHPDVGAVVIFGGDKAFAAGADVKEMAGMDFVEMSGFAHKLQESFSRITQISQPTIAAISGFALGGGLELAMCADFRVAGDNAKLGQPEILLGIIPGAGGTQRLARLVGASRAKELIFGGHMIDAQQASDIGLVNRVVEPASVFDTAFAWALELSQRPKMALAAAKRAIDSGLNTDLATGLTLESVEFASLFATEDQKAGMQSFIESGPGKAKFKGR